MRSHVLTFLIVHNVACDSIVCGVCVCAQCCVACYSIVCGVCVCAQCCVACYSIVCGVCVCAQCCVACYSIVCAVCMCAHECVALKCMVWYRELADGPREQWRESVIEKYVLSAVHHCTISRVSTKTIDNALLSMLKHTSQ